MTELISWSAKFHHQSLVVRNQQNWGLHCRWFVVVQSLSHVWLFATLRTALSQASLSFTVSQGLLKLISIESEMPSNHLILCHPLLHLPSIFPSIRVFSKLVLCIRWPPQYWCFNFSLSPSNEYSGLTSFRIDWFDLLAVWGGLLGSKDHCTMFPYTSLQSSKCVALVQLLSCVRHFAILWTIPCQAPLSSTLSCSLLKFMSIELMILSNQLILCQPFLLLPVMFPSIGSFPLNQLFASVGPCIGASTSASVLPMNIQGWFPLGLTGLISLQLKGLSRVFSNITFQKDQFFSAQPSL